MMSGKVGMSANKMVHLEGTFLWWGLFIPSFKIIAHVADKQAIYVEDNLLLQRLCVPSAKTATYVCYRFNTSFCARDHTINQAISNLNRKFWNKSTLIWVGFLEVRFYLLCSNKTASLTASFEFSYISCMFHIRLL